MAASQMLLEPDKKALSSDKQRSDLIAIEDLLFESHSLEGSSLEAGCSSSAGQRIYQTSFP